MSCKMSKTLTVNIIYAYICNNEPFVSNWGTVTLQWTF